MLKYVIIFAVLLVLLHLYPKNHESVFESPAFESFKNFSDNKFDLKQDCPNILIRDGERIELLNTRQPRVPGINPVYFDNLEDYAEYYKYQRKNKKNCPVLYYQSTYDTQNKKGWRLLVNPFEPNAGLHSGPTQENSEEVRQLLTDANTHSSKFNKNQFLAFDPDDQMVGIQSDLDMKQNPDDPMSKNWAGHEATHNALLSGKFKDRVRTPDDSIYGTQ